MFVVTSFKASASRADVVLFSVVGYYGSLVNDIFSLALTFHRAGAGYSAITFKVELVIIIQ